MTKDEALKMALQELEGIPFYRKYGVRISNAITAIKEALAQPAQEPVLNGWRLRDVYFDADGEPSMHKAPKREWVGLTDEEIEHCLEMSIQGTCRAVEAKLKEKNFD